MNGFHRRGLTPHLQLFYDELADALLQGKQEIALDSMTSDELRSIFQAVTDDHPLILCENTYRCCFLKSAEAVLIRPDYLPSYESLQQELLAKARSIADELKLATLPPLERAYRLHCWFLDNVTYDNDRMPVAYTAAGALLDQKAVCQGIAEAYMLVAQQAGLDCCLVNGNANSPDNIFVNHAWNVVNLGGGFCGHVDTSHEIGLCHANRDISTMAYFMLPDSVIRQERYIAAAPPCIGLPYGITQVPTVQALEDLIASSRPNRFVRVHTAFTIGNGEQEAEEILEEIVAEHTQNGVQAFAVRTLNYQRNLFLLSFHP